jgi:ribosome-binding ATPase YchF (GTP1/OBG family)
MERALKALEDEQAISSIIHSPDEAKMLRSFGFLTEKPWAVVVNVSESEQQERPSVEIPADIARLQLCLSMEQELRQLPEEDRGQFMSELGIETLAADRLIACCYKTLGLVSFLTYGPEDCRAWTIPVDMPAIEAAGKIHSDIQRGFIRAEVVAFEDLKAAGDLRQAKAANKVRLESKQYPVQDGDVITFRFNV